MTGRSGGPAAVCLLTITYPPALGGVAESARRIAGYLVESGYRVHVVTRLVRPAAAGTVARTEEDGAIVHRLMIDAASEFDLIDFRYRKYIRQLDAEVGFDLFHGIFLTVAYPCVLAADGSRGGAPRPTILSIRGTDAASLIDHPTLRSMFVFALERATWVTSVNQLYLDRLREDVDLAGRCSVIRNGVDVATPARWEPGGHRRGVVGTVGEFRTIKDIPLLIRAYAGLPAGLRRGLILAGFFSSREEDVWSRMLIEEFGLGGEVEITGPFDHARLDEHLDRIYVYVQPSAYEGLPNAVLEAAVRGVPLVATAVGGMKEILEDGRSALLVPHGDPAAMTAAIRGVLEDEALALRLSRGARRLAESLSVDREKEEWRALYGRVLSSPAADGP